MSNLFSLLNIGTSSLLTHQRAMDVTGNNIANVDTPGYSRQRLVIQQRAPVRANGITTSTGITADPGIQRFYDQFLTSQLNSENESLGRWSAQQEALEKVELMFNDAEGSGLSNAMNEFWNAWQEVANDPSGIAERTTLLSASQHLAATFNQLYNNIGKFQQDINSHVDGLTTEINDMADRIAELNRKITQVEVGNQNANEFRDERDQLVFELSKMIDINSYEDGDGNLNIDVADGRPLVQIASTWDLTTADNGGVQDIYWQASDGSTVNITTSINSGELKGWIESRDVLMSGYLTEIDDLANTLRTSVNAEHTAGIDLNGNAGLDFFTGTGAGNMAVNATIAADTDLIAAAAVGEGLPGGNSTAIAIANLQSAATMPGGSNFGDYYSTLVGKVGADVQSADFNQSHQTTMVQNMENYRQEASGVSLDEEMINLVKFQHAYNAAAKMITSADEMLDTLMAIGN